MRVAPLAEPPPEGLVAGELLDPQAANIVPAMMMVTKMMLREIIRLPILCRFLFFN
jgi:hypothetical protein